MPPSAATWPVWTGGGLVAVSVFLPWIDFGIGTNTVTAIDVPFVFLLSWENGADGGPGLGVVLLLLAVGAFVLRHVRGLEKISRVAGALCLPAVVMFLVQLNAELSKATQGASGRVPSLPDIVGIGTWCGLVGAASLAWGSRR